MSIKWDLAPETATHYCAERFYRVRAGSVPEVYFDGNWHVSTEVSEEYVRELGELRPNQPQWPCENRIDIVATNGNEGLHYQASPTAAADFLSAGLKILTERGKQYGSDERECSFPQVAQAFNAITGRDLVGSDVCLILALVKQVRQYAQPERFHEDSAVDGVNYTALQAEQLKRERSK